MALAKEIYRYRCSYVLTIKYVSCEICVHAVESEIQLSHLTCNDVIRHLNTILNWTKIL
jgi:hypothetical protein